MAVAAVASLAVGTVIAMRPPAIVPAQDFRTVQVAPQPTAGTTPLTSLSFAPRDTQADAAKADANTPAARALDRRTNGTPAMPSVMPVSFTTAALPPVPADASTGISALASNTSAPPIEPPAPSRGSADDETAVRGTIDRYAASYNGLDADAAQVSLGDCRIDVNGTIARASCAGTASWTARAADGAARTEPRRWTFDLARSGDVWQIVNTKVQNR
jgi:hypothetical protein